MSRGTSSATGGLSGTATEPPEKTKLVTLLFVIGGVASAVGGVLLFVLSSWLSTVGLGFLAGLGSVFGVVLLVGAGVSFVVAYGLWNVQTWGWYAAVVLLSLGVLDGLRTLLQGGGVPLFTLAVGVGGLWALWDEQDVFGLDHELPV